MQTNRNGKENIGRESLLDRHDLIAVILLVRVRTMVSCLLKVILCIKQF